MPLTSLEQVNDEVQHTWNHYTVSPTCASPPVLAHTSSRWLSKQVWTGYKKIFFKKALNEPNEYATFTGTNLRRVSCVITKMEPTDSQKLGQLGNWIVWSCQHVSDNYFPVSTDVTLSSSLCHPWPQTHCESSIFELVCSSPFKLWPLSLSE